MSTSSLIRRHIFGLPLGRIFTTRELINYGSRTSVDQTVWMLVKRGVIVRLARGVFVREGSDLKCISVADVARTKAESFCKRFSVLECRNPNIASVAGINFGKIQFAVDGSTSSFRFGGVAVVLRRVCARKLALASTLTGQFLCALWGLGRAQFGMQKFDSDVFGWLGRRQRKEIRISLHLVPGWLASRFLHWHLPATAFRS
jgi:hypothetical protein